MTTATPKTAPPEWRMFVDFGDGWRNVHIYNGRAGWTRSWHPRHGWDTDDWKLTRGDQPASSRDRPPGLSSLEDPGRVTCAVSNSVLKEWSDIIEQLHAENKHLKKILLFKDLLILTTFVVFMLIPFLLSIF